MRVCVCVCGGGALHISLMVYVCTSSCPVATVGTDQPSYTVNEFEDLWFSVSIIDGQTVPGQQCEIQVGEMDHTATGEEMIPLHVYSSVSCMLITLLRR